MTVSGDNTARLWDAFSGKPVGEPVKYGREPLRSAQFSPDGQRVLTASFDGTARLWDAANGKPIGEPMKHANLVSSAAAFSPDGQRVRTASGDNTGSAMGCLQRQAPRRAHEKAKSGFVSWVQSDGSASGNRVMVGYGTPSAENPSASR